MIRMGVAITVEGWPAATQSQLKQAIQAGTDDGAMYWHNRFLPGHFEMRAPGKYGYKHRTRGYQWRKRKDQGHQKPLTYSGEMRRQALGWATVKSKGEESIVTFKAPRALNFSGGGAGVNYPDLKGELTAITASEVRMINNRVKRSASKKINTIRARRGRRVR